MIAILFWCCVALILYTYFGYPILLFLLAQIWPRPKPYSPATPSVTILIPAYNEEVVIAQKLENLLALEYPSERLQIVVLDDGSEDRTAEIVGQYADQDVELSQGRARQGKMAAIERGVSQARGEIVVITDATNFFQPDALKELVFPFSDPTVGVVNGSRSIVYGDSALGESEGLYWKYESFILKYETRLGCCTAAIGDSMAIRREAFEPLTYTGIGAIDFHMAMWLIRRGYRVIYWPRAHSYERISFSAKEEKERRARMVAGRYQAISKAFKILPFNRPLVVWQIVSHKFLRPLIPFAMFGALLTNILAILWPVQTGGDSLWRLDSPVNLVLLGMQGVFYGMGLFGNRIEFLGKIGKLLYLPTFLVNSNFAALAGLYRFLLGHQTALWKKASRREAPK